MNNRQAIRDGKVIDLTVREYAILEYLARNRNVVVTREQIRVNIWNIDDDVNSNVIDVYIRYLRRKIDDNYDIFYLTAKTITGTVAREAFELLRKGGYQAKIIQITAKEKLCMCDEMECNPVHCPYAKGHYDRVNNAVFQLLLQEDVFSRDI